MLKTYNVITVETVSTKERKMSEENKCPVPHAGMTSASRGTSNRDWWPKQLNLNILHQHAPASNPMGTDFDYAKQFKKHLS